MEQKYMLKIWAIIGLKENQDLTVKEQQDKIINILALMREESEFQAIEKCKEH